MIRYFVHWHPIQPTTMIPAPTNLNSYASNQLKRNPRPTSLSENSTKYYLYCSKWQTHLTVKEKHCLSANTQLKTMEDLAKELCISIKTVKKHFRRVKKKQGAQCRLELYTMAKNNGLI